MHQPDFSLTRAGIDGFTPEGDKPSRENLEALGQFITRSATDFLPLEPKDWDEALSLMYRALAFWRNYYCGVTPDESVCTGGIQSKKSSKRKKRVMGPTYD